MNISFETQDKVNGLMTITVEEADYQADVEKNLKSYRKRANVPGFRPGQVPMSHVKRMFGASVKMDAINKLLGDSLQKYVADNKLPMLGQPLANESQEAVDLEGPAPYVFKFDIALAPEFSIELGQKDAVDYYDISVEDKIIDEQVDMYASRNGHYDKAEAYDAEQRDMLKGDLRELDAEGNTLEGGIEVEAAVLMPQYIKVDDQDNDTEISSLLKIDKEKVAEHTGNFSYQITEISRFVKAEVNKELFENVFGSEAGVETEEQFREKIAEGLKAQFAMDSDYKFMLDVRKYAEEKVGELQMPEALLKRIMLQNSQDKGADYVEKNFEGSIKELKWHLIREKLAEQCGVRVEDDDVKNAAKEVARAQFAQYGMSNVPDEYLDNYAQEMLKKRDTVDNLVERAIDRKLTVALKDVVKLNRKATTIEEFNKMLS